MCVCVYVRISLLIGINDGVVIQSAVAVDEHNRTSKFHRVIVLRRLVLMNLRDEFARSTVAVVTGSTSSS